MAEVPLPERENIDKVDRAQLYAWDDSASQWVQIEVDASGNIKTASSGDPATETTLSSIDGKVATETTLSAIDTTATSIDGKVATETTVASIDAATTSIDGKVATETTLAAVAAITDALASNGTDTLDVSGSSVTVSGTPTVASDNPGLINFGQQTVTTAGTPSQVQSTVIPDGATMWVKGLPSNTGDVYIGDSTVDSSSGYPLAAGESLPMSVENSGDVWVDADTSGEGVAWIIA